MQPLLLLGSMPFVFIFMTWLGLSPHAVLHIPAPLMQPKFANTNAHVVFAQATVGRSQLQVSCSRSAQALLPIVSSRYVLAGCERACHTYCANLDALPEGDWFCWVCMENRDRQLAGEEPVDTAGMTMTMHCWCFAQNGRKLEIQCNHGNWYPSSLSRLLLVFLQL